MLGRTFSYRLVGLAWEFLPLPPAYRLPKRSGVRERDRPTNPPDHMRIWRGVIAGLVGGLVAAGAMSIVHKSLAGISAGATAHAADQPAPERRRHGEGRRLLRAVAPSPS